ncbi:MAG: hypothetical protein ABI599_13840 [Flavobacteriales bacterium]
MSKWIAYVLLASGLAVAAHLLWQTRVLSSNSTVLGRLSCTCPDYHVELGQWNLNSPLLDTLENLDKSEVYVTGAKNNWSSDPGTMFDYMIAEGEVVGIDRVVEGDPWNPVIRVARWDHVSEFTYPLRKWGAILMFLLGVLILWLRRTKVSHR